MVHYWKQIWLEEDYRSRLLWSSIEWLKLWLEGQAVAQLVEALPYKPEGRGFDSLWLWCRLSL